VIDDKGGDWKKIVPSLPQRHCRIKPPNPAFRALLNATLDTRERQLSTNSNFRIASAATAERPLCSAISGDR